MKKIGMMGEVDTDPNTESNKWLARFKTLNNQITVMDIFECDGKFYHGNCISAVKQFMETKRADDMLSDWLDNNWSKVEVS